VPPSARLRGVHPRNTWEWVKLTMGVGVSLSAKRIHSWPWQLEVSELDFDLL